MAAKRTGSRKPKKRTPEQVVQEILVWWLLIPVVVVVVAGFLVDLAVTELTGKPAATLTQGIVAVPAMLVYLALRFVHEFGWPPNFLPQGGNRTTNSNRGSGTLAAPVVKAGFLSRVNFNQNIQGPTTDTKEASKKDRPQS